MKKTNNNITERKKALIDDQDYLSEEEKKKAKEKVEKNQKPNSENKEETKKFEEKEVDELDLREILEDEYDSGKSVTNELTFFSEEDREEENEYPDFGKEFLNITAEEQAKKNKENDLLGAKDYKKLLEIENKKKEEIRTNKENDLPGYKPEEKKYEFKEYYNPKQSLSNSMALKMGVSQEELDKINEEAEEKFGKDIFSEAVDSGIVNIGANVIGGGELLLDKVVGWKNNPLTKANEYLQKKVKEEEREVAEAVERTGKGSSAEFCAKVVVAITESLPDLALALMTGGGSTAAKAAKGIKKVWKSTAANPNFWYAAETQLYPIYKEALADGATEDEALRTALGGAPLSAGLEGNLGFEKYIKTKTPMTWKQGFLNYAKAAGLEGVEEAVKNAAPEVVEKWVFDPYKPLLKVGEGEEAVLNLSEAGRDFLIGGTGGLVSSTPRLFDISLDAYNDKRLKNGWDRKANNQKETW
ncbi:MAG: hypothetical protein IKL18_06300 [Oscillospiraceae bacterium]|nr:hypothetical protein [Oscillospiraceae bacterium]